MTDTKIYTPQVIEQQNTQLQDRLSYSPVFLSRSARPTLEGPTMEGGNPSIEEVGLINDLKIDTITPSINPSDVVPVPISNQDTEYERVKIGNDDFSFRIEILANAYSESDFQYKSYPTTVLATVLKSYFIHLDKQLYDGGGKDAMYGYKDNPNTQTNTQAILTDGVSAYQLIIELIKSQITGNIVGLTMDNPLTVYMSKGVEMLLLDLSGASSLTYLERLKNISPNTLFIAVEKYITNDEFIMVVAPDINQIKIGTLPRLYTVIKKALNREWYFIMTSSRVRVSVKNGCIYQPISIGGLNEYKKHIKHIS